ncbi:unnamed protein product [Phaeothamnion confervicola]
MAPHELLRPHIVDCLRRRGSCSGFAPLREALRGEDLLHRGSLNWDQFCSAFEHAGISLARVDMRTFFEQFAEGGTVSYEPLFETLRGRPSRQRLVQIRAVFVMLDDDGDGVVTLAQIADCLKPSGHPDVRLGVVGAGELKRWVLSQLAEAAGGAASLGMDAWIEFQNAITAHMDDAQFT